MKSTLLFFGRLSDRFGRARDVELPEAGCTVAELKSRLGSEDPSFAEAFASGPVHVAIDQRMAEDGAAVRPGQEIAFFSPLSGG